MTKPISAKIISDTPGRLRLRIVPRDRQSQKMQQIAPQLEKQANIQQVKTNIQHGSILIHHDSDLENLTATLRDLGIIFVDLAEGNTDAATGITNAVVDLNNRVERITQGAVDIGFLFPFGLSILSVRQLLSKGWQLEAIPWYMLAWYAFDSFIKLNCSNQPRTSSENGRLSQLN